MTSQELQDALEQLVDRTSLAYVLAALGNVCQAKSIHLAETWQDFDTAGDWEKAALVCDDSRHRIDALLMDHARQP